MAIKFIMIVACFFISIFLMRRNLMNELSIFLTFFPFLISFIIDNFEWAKLITAKILLSNRSISFDINLKKNYNLYDDIYLDNDYLNLLEEKIKENMLKRNIKVGRDNKKLKIEPGQTIKSGTDNNIKVKIPLILNFQVEGSSLVCYLKNSCPSIAYREIPDILDNLSKIWDLLDECLKSINAMQLKSTYYKAELNVNSDTFKNVYLAPFSSDLVSQLELNKKNSKIKLYNDKLVIESRSFTTFKNEILNYIKLSKKYLVKDGD